MIYLKTYFYREFEIDYIIANLIECYDYIDNFLVFEYDCHHTGEKRNFFEKDILDNVPNEFKDKLKHYQCSITKHTVETDNENLIHQQNEPVMRSYFTQVCDLNDDDIVISVDADEILYSDKMDYLIEETKKYGTVACKMHQFFYKPNYLWKDKVWKSAISTLVKNINPKFLNNWRDIGRLTDDYVGGHFSWCMTPEDMVFKLNTYSHPRYRKYADIDVLSKAIEDKQYIFNLNAAFEIEELSLDSNLIPKSMRK